MPRSRRFGGRFTLYTVVAGIVAVAVAGIVLALTWSGKPSAHPAGEREPSTSASGGGGAAGASSGGQSGSAGAPRSAGPSIITSIPMGDGSALKSKILPPSPGSTSYPVDNSTNGVMNLTQYAKHYFAGSTIQSGRLTQEGFRVAASTDYVRPDGLEVATHLVQFADATGARAYVESEKAAWAANGGITSTFPISGTEDATGYAMSATDSLGNRRTVMYEHVGNIAVVVNAYTKKQIDQAADAALLRQQIAAIK